MTDTDSKSPEKEAQQRELAQYIADMLLELRSMARAAGLKTLLGLSGNHLLRSILHCQ